jgi:hypothetical protein
MSINLLMTDGAATLVPGISDTYTIVVSNAGPTNGTGALATTVNLPVNASVTFTFTTTINPSEGRVCPTVPVNLFAVNKHILDDLRGAGLAVAYRRAALTRAAVSSATAAVTCRH